MKTTFLQWYADGIQALTLFARSAVQPVRYASITEAVIIAGVGVLLLIAGLVISRGGRGAPDYEAAWTEKRLQFTGVFGTVALLLAFLRYEGIPYASMTLVLVAAISWLLATIVQLLRYRRLVVNPARARWSERKAHDQYLPTARSATKANRVNRRPAR